MQTLHMLVVDDSPGDILLLKTMLEEAKCNVEIITTHTTKAALDILNDHENQPAIDLILLDFFIMGGMSSVDLYRAVENDSALKHIPIMVYTGSALEDVQKKLDIDTRMYLHKTGGYEESLAMIEKIKAVAREHLHLIISRDSDRFPTLRS